MTNLRVAMYYLVVEKCTSLLNAISSNMLESLWMSKKITVESCDSLEQVFDLEGLIYYQYIDEDEDEDEDYDDAELPLADLEEIKLTELPKLRCIWNKDPEGILSFRNLRWLDIQKCNNLRNLFPAFTLPSLHLEGLKITDCLNMEEIVENEAIDCNGFYSRHILLQVLPNLTSFYSGNEYLEFSSLKTMKISGCPRIKTLFTSTNEGWQETSDNGNLDVSSASFFNDEDAFDSLVELELEDLYNIKEIWQGQHGSFRQLTTLTVSLCRSLTHLLPYAVAKGLLQIKSIIINDCEMMEEITASEEEEATVETTFSQLNSLKLINLPNLKSFCSGSITFSFSSLEEVLVENCPQLKTFSNGTLNTPKLEKVHTQSDDWIEVLGEGGKGDLNMAIQHWFIQKQHSRELKLSSMSSMEEIWQGQLDASSFGNLRVLHVEECDKILKVFPISLFQNFENLEVIVCGCSSLKEVFELGRVSGVVRHSQPIPKFQNLILLRVGQCKSLMHLLSSGIAKSLVQIRSIIVSDCEMMEEIIASEEGKAADHETTFSQLSSLKLIDLPILTSFCTGSITFSFPSLEEVLVENCPQLKTFSHGTLNTPKLEKVHTQLDDDRIEVLDEGI